MAWVDDDGIDPSELRAVPCQLVILPTLQKWILSPYSTQYPHIKSQCNRERILVYNDNYNICYACKFVQTPFNHSTIQLFNHSKDKLVNSIQTTKMHFPHLYCWPTILVSFGGIIKSFVIYQKLHSKDVNASFPFILSAYYPGITRAKGGIPPIEHNIPLHMNNAFHLF